MYIYAYICIYNIHLYTYTCIYIYIYALWIVCFLRNLYRYERNLPNRHCKGSFDGKRPIYIFRRDLLLRLSEVSFGRHEATYYERDLSNGLI